MKIIHCSDIHLDSKMESNLSKEKTVERKNELLMTFLNMIDFAKENEVQGIIIAGDLFDSNRVSAKTKNIVMDSIQSNPKIDFFYLSGNHDNDNFIGDMDVLPDNLKIFANEWTTFNIGNVYISGVQLSAENNHSIYNTLMLNKNELNIVVLHGQESKYSGKDKTEVINLNLLKNRNIDYLALGHIHQFKVNRLDNRGVYCYCGCLEGRGFDECGDKGFVLLTVDSEGITPEFIPFGKRKLLEVPVDITDLQTSGEIEAAIDEQLKDVLPEFLIKIILVGKVTIESERDLSYITQKLSEKYYFVKVYDETSLAINIEDYKYDISLKGEFIRLVLNSRLPEKDKEQIIINGINALSGEEID